MLLFTRKNNDNMKLEQLQRDSHEIARVIREFLDGLLIGNFQSALDI